ncbi:TRAP transporter small permease subunit [Puniceibacterium sp. IMCC21224]|uniref:TRAP transporter small permease subunit n=1 Tax=Puniceibacterium sp. IMCC21224 TaxID=1618204 RepID=UPI00065CDF19|nr:TRAP transporter small permease [Puniceibacterium sp. IMCC21224]KMK66538.1 TRAP-type C4-dicarboxylate transport system, small permease component [Puniceibacterium sp. IMCC21224]
MKRIIPSSEAALRAISHAACIVGGWLVILLSIGICVEVFLRKVFSESLQGIDEYGGYTLATTASLGLAYCFYEHAHIQIDVVVRKLPKRLGRVFAVIAILALGIVVGMLALGAIRLTDESYLFGAFSNTPLRTPIYYPQAIWAGGFCLFFLAIVLRLLHLLQTILLGDKDATSDLLGEARSGEDSQITRIQGIE